MRKVLAYLLALAGLVLAGVPASAQVTGSEIRGYVADGAGKPVAGADVTAFHRPTGTSYRTVSNGTGWFSIPALPSGGPYEVEVSFLGLATVEYDDLVLTQGEPCELLPVMLPVREIDAVVVQSERVPAAGVTGAGAVLDRTRIEAVPTVDRHLGDILSFTPQLVYSPYLGCSIAGAHPFFNQIRVDGAPTSVSGYPVSTPVSLDFIESVRITAAPFDVRQSGFTGGAVDIVTRSGTNRWSASAYSFLSGRGLSGAEDLNHQTYGFTVGTPVVRDKLFLFAGGEYMSGQTGMEREYTAQANVRTDWIINDSNRLMSRIQVLDSQAYSLLTFVTALKSRLSERLSNELRASGVIHPGFGSDVRLTDNLSVLSGRHRITVGTEDALSLELAELSAYVQDEWMPTARFSMNFGVRAEAFFLTRNDLGGAVRKIRPSISPRLGFRYYMDDACNSLLRGGVGLFSGRVPTRWLQFPASEPFSEPQILRTNLGFDQNLGRGWRLSMDGLFSQILSDPFFLPDDSGSGITLSQTSHGYAYSLSFTLQKHFAHGLDVIASYALNRSFSVFDALYPDPVKSRYYHAAKDPADPTELSLSVFDRPHHLSVLASYVSPMYGSCRTRFSLAFQGVSGHRYSYTLKETELDFNGDGVLGNSLIDIPLKGELVEMAWSDPASAAKFENFIRTDEYLSSHRGDWSRRYAGATPFESRMDLQLAEDFFWDRRHGRRLELVADLINAAPLFSSELGKAWVPNPYRAVLSLDTFREDTHGDRVPVYSFCDDNAPLTDAVRSAWRCQIGVRLVF